MIAEFVLRTFDVARQVADEAYRHEVLSTLATGDVVQAVWTETGEVYGTRLLEHIDTRREDGGGSYEDWPQRFLAGDWRADDWGWELDAAQMRVEYGWVLVRPPLTPEDAAALLAQPEPKKPEFSWALYEKHMQDTHEAVLHGYPPPKEPWA